MKKYIVYFCDICDKEIDQYKGVYQAQKRKFCFIDKDAYYEDTFKEKLHFCPKCYYKLMKQKENNYQRSNC